MEEKKTTKAQQKAVRKYKEKNYERLEISVHTGEKDIIKKHAQRQGESLNGFVNRAIKQTMEADNKTE